MQKGTIIAGLAGLALAYPAAASADTQLKCEGSSAHALTCLDTVPRHRTVTYGLGACSSPYDFIAYAGRDVNKTYRHQGNLIRLRGIFDEIKMNVRLRKHGIVVTNYRGATHLEWTMRCD